MIRIFENGRFTSYGVWSYLYALLPACMNPANNRLEINGRPMSSIDLCAYANITSAELRLAIKKLIAMHAIIVVRGKNREFYYVNPNYIREESILPEDIEWLLSIFEEEGNSDIKDLVYIEKSHKNISIDIGETIKKL